MKDVTLYSDGACSGNPGAGGYCAILKYGNAEKIISGYESNTTNNRMELLGVIKGLEGLKEPCKVTIISDSKYVCDAINNDWLDSWKRNYWRKSNKKPVANADLWSKLHQLLSIHKTSFKWVQGHSGHIENERCDKIAVSEYIKFKNMS